MTDCRSDRYSRQILFAPIGLEGQERIRKGHAVLVGCGALGSTIANSLVRAGVGCLTIIDPDRLELSNLQRQILFDEAAVASGQLKAEAARDRLGQINSEVRVVALTDRLDRNNASALIGRPEVVLDGTDNLASRYLLNDVCVRDGIPWIYGGCAASWGMAMPVVPGKTPCLRCLFPEPPPPELSPTCNQVGIIAPIAHLIASVQAAEGLKILSGHLQAVSARLFTADLWETQLSATTLAGPDPACPCCSQRRFDFLEGRR